MGQLVRPLRVVVVVGDPALAVAVVEADPGPEFRELFRLKVAVYNRFLQSMGGGERHSSMLAQVLADDGHEVDLVGHKDVGKDLLADHLGL
ncbi:MAG TPA: hypothetical protein VG409_18130, partial [Actinomycetota bacterium]|nr:hypothetical protein [Actinomycetota bacterium]